MKKKAIIILSVLGVIAIIIGICLLKTNNLLTKSKIEIIDATYICNNLEEKFYEDDEYIYYFPCQQSSSTYVKFPNDNKLLVTQALEEKKVTIDTLIKAGLNVTKKEK